MINFEKNDSPFYKMNEMYCEQILHKFNEFDVEVNGYCNSFGYNFAIDFTSNNLHYTFSFQKSQTTENGVIIPMDAHDYSTTTLIISGLNKTDKLVIGKSLWKRYLMPKEDCSNIPSPFFIKTNLKNANDGLIKKVVDIINTYKIKYGELKNGNLKLKLNQAITDPLSLITVLDKLW